MAPTFFSNFQNIFFNYFTKSPQTTIALKFLTHIISALGGVRYLCTLYIVTGLRYLDMDWVQKSACSGFFFQSLNSFCEK